MGLFDIITDLFTGAPASLPTDKQTYAGQWQGATITLGITPEGDVDYKQSIVEGTTTRNRSVTGPIKSFDGDGFIVGLLDSNTRFEVQRPPHTDGATWKMTLDGEELQRLN